MYASQWYRIGTMTRTSLTLEQKWQDTLPELNEKQRRHYAAREAKAYGFGGVAYFSRVTGLSRDTINQGIKELESGQPTGYATS